MRHELTQRFYFESAHTLERDVDAGTRSASRRVHGHTYDAAVTVTAERDAATGMVVDLAALRAAVAGARERLDHRLLDDVDGLGAPTLENLCAWLWHAIDGDARWTLVAVEVGRRASGDSCRLTR